MTIKPTSLFTVVQPTTVLADPHILSDIRDRRSIIDAIYDALVRRRQDGSFAPWLAQSWQVDATCRHWRFTLRKDVRCHDGGTLRASDAVASILRALSPDLPGELGTQGVLRAYLEGAVITALDENTLTIDTPTPLADLLDLLVDISIVPARAHATLPNRAVGSGPYSLLHAEPGRIELRAFAEHWAGKAPAEQLRWLAEPDPQRRLALLNAGEADLVVDPPVLHSEVEGAGSFSAPGYLCIIFMFNLFKGPCADVRVRQAVNHAIDVSALIADPAIAGGAAVQLAGPLTPRHIGTDPALTPYTYDPDYARSLLQAAGYAQGLDLEMDIPARFPDESIVLALRVVEYLSAVGIRVRLHIHEDRPGYAEKIRAKNFGDICCFDSSPASTWRVYCEKLDARRQGPWWQGYHNEVVHGLLDQASGMGDIDVRTNLLRKIFQQVHHDAPWLFLYAPHSRWVLGSAAMHWQPSIEGRVRIVAKPPDGY